MPQHVREYNPISPSMGVYLATVMNSADVNRSGRLEVSIPALQTYKDAPDRSVADVTYTVRYCSPFAGQTPVRDARGTNSGDFHATQKSYGFWAVPPDLDTRVLVICSRIWGVNVSLSLIFYFFIIILFLVHVSFFFIKK